jgi:hypothetical protein
MSNKLRDLLNITALSGVMKVATYPFGNARYNQLANGTWEFECQHGPKECALNIVFACIMAKVSQSRSTILGLVPSAKIC